MELAAFSQLLTWALAFALAAFPARADTPLHCLWELHGKHNTVFLLGSIHVLRPADYPLAPALLDAYNHSQALIMEVNLQDIDPDELRTTMLATGTLPAGKTLGAALGPQRYAHATDLAHEVGFELQSFEHFAPWFAAEAISEAQLAQLGFDSQSGVEMYFVERARGDGKRVTGLETVHDQIALFEALSPDAQANYLMTSLEQAHELPTEVNEMVGAWKRGDTPWFAKELASEFDSDPTLYQSLLSTRNRKWVPQLEALLKEDRNYLVIVGTGHLVGRDSVIELLKKDGISATQQ